MGQGLRLSEKGATFHLTPWDLGVGMGVMC